MAYSFEDFARDSNVSRETLADYQAWSALLLKWNRKINLVSPTALGDFWRRHALDSWQIWPHIPSKAENFIDLGSGAGFPGLAMAIGCKARGSGHVTLVESAGKKTSFLRTVIRDLALPVTATTERAENIESKPYDVITARAFAPLPRLFSYAQPFWGEGTIGLFLKGEAVEEELTEASKTWTYDVEKVPSVSDGAGYLLKVTKLQPR
ncbi:16S rRNA (guanine(527)-N(7))-methyltransferase RsmG [Hellea sp.]|nr:16S rRNA (guanine(527)-N(7))-methyltransferase RsmG [Hellea sp.]